MGHTLSHSRAEIDALLAGWLALVSRALGRWTWAGRLKKNDRLLLEVNLINKLQSLPRRGRVASEASRVGAENMDVSRILLSPHPTAFASLGGRPPQGEI
jgi:hypothetical protein